MPSEEQEAEMLAEDFYPEKNLGPQAIHEDWSIDVIPGHITKKIGKH
jgi:hypothetical protein